MSSTRQGQLPRWGRNIRGARRRLAVLAAQVVVAGLCVAMAGASAQQMQFASYPDFAANHVIETCTVDAGGNQNAIPEFDWGEPIWIRVSNVFFADANFTDGEVAFKFWRKSVPSYGFMVLQASGTGALPTVGLRAFEPLEDNLAAFQDNTQPIPLDHRYQGIIQPSSINRLDFNGNSYRNCRVYGGLALPDTAHPARLSTTPKGWPAAEPPVFRAVFTPGEWCIRVEQAHTSGDDAQARTYPSAAGYITIRVRNPLLLRERQTDGGAVSLMEDVAHPEWAWQNGSPTFRASVWAGQAGNLLHGYWNGTTATDPTFSELNTGRVRHGVTSDRYPFYVVDNSRWRTSVDGSGLASGLGADPLPSSLRVRFDRPSLNPTGRDSIGTAALPTNVIDATGALLATVPWGPGPYQAIPPDMPASRPTDPGSFRAFPTNGANLAFYWINDLNAELDNTKPALADITTGALVPPVFGAGTPRPAYTVANREFKATLRVPLYQADTGYQTGDPGLPTGVYPTASNSIAAFIDSDADGVRDPDEAYRDFNVSVQVPADFRMRPSAATATIDFGLVAHNTLSPEKTLAVQNIGNVGLRWLRIDEERRRTGPTESRYKNLFSAANDHDASSVLQNVGKGVCIPPWESASVTVGAPRRHFWWSFDPTAGPDFDPAAWFEGTTPADYNLPKHGFAPKAVPDCTEVALSSATATAKVYFVSPFGQPVGAYSNDTAGTANSVANNPRFFIYEDYRDPTYAAPENVLDVDASDRPVAGIHISRKLTDPDDSLNTGQPLVVKITVTDRQLTEERGVSGIDRPDVTADPARPAPNAGDSQPAVLRYRNPVSTGPRRLAVFWTSNRPNGSGENVYSTTAPWNGQEWAIYTSATHEIKDSATRLWPFWRPNEPIDPSTPATNVGNPPVGPFPAASQFPPSLNGAPVVAQRYTSPSIVSRANGTPQDYLYFQGEAYTQQGAATTRTTRLFYAPLDLSGTNGPQPGQVYAIPPADGMGAHSPRGLEYYVPDLTDGNATTTLIRWAFWLAGSDGKAYYSYYRSDTGRWAPAQRLPLYGDFSEIKDLSLLVRTIQNAGGQYEALIEVTFAGFSRFRRRSDIYMARFYADVLQTPINDARSGYRAKLAFPAVSENLPTFPNENTCRSYFARNLDWSFDMSTLYVTRIANPGVDQIPTTITPAGGWTYNPRDFSYSGTFNYASVEHPELDGLNKITVYPLSGVITFARPMDSTDQIWATYTPGVLRVTAAAPPGMVMDSSPSTFLDTRVGTVRDGDNTLTSQARNRRWVFWTRKANATSLPTLMYKTMRMMVKTPAIDTSQGAVSVDVDGVSVTTFGMDPARGNFYFLPELEGKQVVVRQGGSVIFPITGQGHDPRIRWRDERADTALPVPSNRIQNQGKLCAIPDIADALSITDLGNWRVWLVWSSMWKSNQPTGAPKYDPDLHYMSIAPALDTW